MCGIAGIISHDTALTGAANINSALRCLRHRGPESEASWTNSSHTVVLGHTRLCIIDTTAAAAQPMHYADRYTIIHNGELYNYIELRHALQQKGYSFTSASDTEVIVAAYDAWGAECLQQFDGMFAFAIWDERDKKLFAARDRFGEKPFFFFHDNNQFVFASELKALWSLGVNKEVNSTMLYNFLTIGYTTNPSDPEETFYQNIHQLPAASFLFYAPSGQLQLEKYWQLYPEIDHKITPEDAVAQFSSLLSESMRKRLRSDVPIGTSLSGGLDSSVIVAMCDKQSTAQYTHKCFTASFDGFDKDEKQYAAQVASQYRLEHVIVDLNENEILPLMEEVMRFQEEPFGSASVLAQYRVYQAAKKNGVTVLLDGQGADEVLAGYHHYYKWYWQELYRSRRLHSSKELAAARAMGIEESFSLKNKLAALLPEFTAGIWQGRKAKQAANRYGLDRDFAFSNKRNLYYATPTRFDLNGALYFNTFVHGLDELLRLADRNSMAHGTEVRLPFLSHELVAFLFTLPPQLKIRQGWTKWLLRKAVENDLPQNIVWRKDKIGFEPPQKKWMENGDVQYAVMNGKKKLAALGFLDPASLKKIKPHSAYAADNFDWKCWSASYLFD